MNAAHAFRNLRDVYDAMGSCGGRPFLVDGTLLGCIREGRILAHDKDVDLGLFEEDLASTMRAAVVRQGFTVKHELGTPDRGYQWSFVRRGLKTDVFIYYLKDGMRFHAAWSQKLTVPIRYDYPAFDLETRRFYGQDFRVPSPPEAFLARKYGDWKTPVVKWDWAWGPKNATTWTDA